MARRRAPARLGDDERALDAIYREEADGLLRVAYLITGSSAMAEDALHEAFLRCAPRLGSVDHPARYLRAAVVNECRTRWQRDQRRRVDLVVEHFPPSEFPDEAVELRSALAQLTERQRAAVVLRYFVDLPDDEIARTLGCRPATVRSLLRRAILVLKEALR